MESTVTSNTTNTTTTSEEDARGARWKGEVGGSQDRTYGADDNAYGGKRNIIDDAALGLGALLSASVLQETAVLPFHSLLRSSLRHKDPDINRRCRGERARGRQHQWGVASARRKRIRKRRNIQLRGFFCPV